MATNLGYEPETEPAFERGYGGRRRPGGGSFRTWGAVIDDDLDLDEEQEWLSEEAFPQGGKWTGSAQQREFAQRVLKAHIELWRRTKGAPLPDLPAGELKRVEGAPPRVQMKPGPADAASKLLRAANADLAKAKDAGEPDALRSLKLTATSGYRSAAQQIATWLGHFRHSYYEKSAAARAALAAGPHSAEAVAHMLKPKAAGGFGLPARIAPPGYSRHQAGIAVDFLQERVKGYPVPNDFDHQGPWRSSWFYRWLRQRKNAARFGFQPYGAEAWHWEHRPAASVRETKTAGNAVSSSGVPGLLEFEARALPVRMAIYCPQKLVGQRSIDVVFYAHGLNRCGGLRNLPADFITKTPFQLGKIVDNSPSGVALVVPFLDWENLSRNKLAIADTSGHLRWHRLANPDKLNQVIAECMSRIGEWQGGKTPSLSRLIIAGHSRAYDFLNPLANKYADPAMREGALGRLSAVWALDTAYACRTVDWANWLRSKPDLNVKIFYKPKLGGKETGTKVCGEAFAELAARLGNRLLVTKVGDGGASGEQHCDIPAKRLPDLLSSLNQEQQTEWEAGNGSNPIVGRVCAISGRIATQTSSALRALAAYPDARSATRKASDIKERAAGHINAMSGQMIPLLSRLTREEVDTIIGCMGRVEHAIGRETLRMRRLRAAAHQRLKMP